MEEIARAFSEHRFAETYPHLAPAVRWTNIGAESFTGREAIVDACDRSAAYLAGVTTTSGYVRTVVGETAVVVDTRTQYTDPDGGTSHVASCDIYEFADGQVVEITSYTVELRNT